MKNRAMTFCLVFALFLHCFIINAGAVSPMENNEIAINSDVEAYGNDWFYYVDQKADGYVYRATPEYDKIEYLTDYTADQILFSGESLYILAGNKIIQKCMNDEKEVIVIHSESKIMRFAKCGEYIYYLSSGTIFRYDCESLRTTTIYTHKDLDSFWLENKSTLSYMIDDSYIYQMNLITKEVDRINNNATDLGEMIPIVNSQNSTVKGMTLESLRNKFPDGKYWNHADNPGTSKSVNNQDGYTSIPCTNHKKDEDDPSPIGTPQQTCNAFWPGSIALSWQCMGYAEKCGYDMTGYNPRNNANGWYTYTNVSALDNLKAGDIVRYKNDRHSIYVIAVSGDKVTYTDCNHGGNCIIGWDLTITKSTLRSTFTYVRSAPFSISNPGVPSEPNVEAVNMNFPDSFTVGEGCSPSGYIVASNTVMTWIWMGIFNQSGARVAEASENIDTTSYDIAELAGRINFSGLQEGTYSVEIDVVCGNNYFVPYSKTFTVTGSAKYYLDLNGFLDGQSVHNIDTYGCVDVYINGSIYHTNCMDFYEYFPYGTTYEIKNIQAASGHSYTGVHAGSLSGTITGDTSVELAFGTNYYLDLNGYLDGAYSGDIRGYGMVDIYINGTLRESGGGDFYMTFPYGTTYEINNIQTVPGHRYIGVYSGSLSGTITENTIVELKFGTTSEVTFDPNGGDVSKDNKTVICGEMYGSMPTPTRANYSFDGWYTERNGGIMVIELSVVTETTDHTLYAHWTHNCSAGHDYVAEVITPTCTQQGYTEYICDRCGDYYRDQFVPALGHNWDEGTVLSEPTASQPGEILYRCLRCGESDTQTIPPEGNTPCDGGSSCPGRNFTDMPPAGVWSHAGIDYVISHGLMNGMSTTSFQPEGSMTRAMLVTVLWRYAGQPVEGSNSFTDVPSNVWYTQAVAWAAENGIVTGIGGGRFNPDGQITREQLAVILYRYCKSIGIDTSDAADITTFPDANKVSGYAIEALSWAVKTGLVTGSAAGGKVYLEPQGNATRAQVATILMRFIQNVVE